ncbi:hypothetical protein NEIFL0001_0448 [Neisseria flavescens SK114]|nr:hypothetical protein NEIFL0001_0448 [Neisseria flavescens SK114]
MRTRTSRHEYFRKCIESKYILANVSGRLKNVSDDLSMMLWFKPRRNVHDRL